MQFGLMLPHFRQVASPEGIVRVAQAAEETGFASLWITDRTIIYPGDDQDKFGTTFYDPFATLAYAAAVTKRVMLGESVIIVPYRNPFTLARMTATLDRLSHGRHVFGLGVSGGKDDTRKEFAAIGVPLEQRGPKTDEAMRVMMELWTSESPSYHGNFWQFQGFHFEPKPVQKPHPPIWVGGNRSFALRRTLEYGDAWHPSTIDLDKLEAGVKHLKEEAPKYGRSFSDIDIAPRESIKILDGASSRPECPLIGSFDQVLKSLERYQQIGATHMVLDTFFGRDGLQQETVDSMLKTMERIAREMMPRFQ